MFTFTCGLFKLCSAAAYHSRLSFGYVFSSQGWIAQCLVTSVSSLKAFFHGEPLPGIEGHWKLFHLPPLQTLPSADAFDRLCLQAVLCYAFFFLNVPVNAFAH